MSQAIQIEAIEHRPDAVIAIGDAMVADGLRMNRAYRIPALLLRDGNQDSWVTTAIPWLDRTIKWGHQLVVVIADEDERKETREIFDLVAAHHHRCLIDETTIEATGAVWGRNFLATLKRQPTWATQLERPWAGRPAFVVAAGPSLDLNGHLLKEARSRGPVIAVNTSLEACLYHDCVPDIVVCVESKDVSAHLRRVKELSIQCVLDAKANPLNWAPCPGALAMTSHEPAFVDALLKLGQRPIAYGGSVACAATALAIAWGASPVVLIGQDLGYTGGRAYAKGTQFDDIRVEVKNGLVVFDGESKQMRPTPAVMRDAWSLAGTIVSSHEMDGFFDWYTKTAAAHAIWNCTEGGACIPNAFEMPLRTALGMCRPSVLAEPSIPPSIDTTALRAELAHQAEYHLTVKRLEIRNFPLLNLWAGPAILRARAKGLDALEYAESVQNAIDVGAREILEMCGG